MEEGRGKSGSRQSGRGARWRMEEVTMVMLGMLVLLVVMTMVMPR